MHEEGVKTVLDIAAFSATIAAIVQWLPPVAAVLSIIWLSIQILDYLIKKRWRDK